MTELATTVASSNAKSEKTAQIESINLATLIEANAILTRQLEAKQKRIEYLEYVLEQRSRLTKAEFDPAKMERMKRLCYGVLLANPGVGFTYAEFEGAFENQQGFRSANTGQRLRDLYADGLAWRDGNPVKYYLKLKENREESPELK